MDLCVCFKKNRVYSEGFGAIELQETFGEGELAKDLAESKELGVISVVEEVSESIVQEYEDIS